MFSPVHALLYLAFQWILLIRAVNRKNKLYDPCAGLQQHPDLTVQHYRPDHHYHAWTVCPNRYRCHADPLFRARHPGQRVHADHHEFCLFARPVHHLSYVINYHYGKRYSDFVNKHRVAYVKQLMENDDGKHLKLETVSAEAGFLRAAISLLPLKK